MPQNSPPGWKNKRVLAIDCMGGGVQLLSQLCGRLALHIRRQRRPASGRLSTVTLRLFVQRNHRSPAQEGQLPRSRVVYALITRWGHVADDSAPFAMTAAVVRDCAPSRCPDTRGHGCMVGDELPLLRKWWRGS